MKRFLFLVVCGLMCSAIAYAHPGRTDSRGGHYNRSTGEYHYHHGYSAHQHPNGVCPYATAKPTSTPAPEPTVEWYLDGFYIATKAPTPHWPPVTSTPRPTVKPTATKKPTQAPTSTPDPAVQQSFLVQHNDLVACGYLAILAGVFILIHHFVSAPFRKKR